MIRAANLELVADALETAAGATTEANQNVTGQWLRIAEAAETLADVTNDLNDSVLGYMERTALALESMAGTDGDAENPNYNGKLKRIVDALEDMNAEVGTGSLENRLVLAAQAYTGTSTLTWISGANVYDPVFGMSPPPTLGDTIDWQVDDDIGFGSLYDSGTHVATDIETEDGVLSFADFLTLGFSTTYNVRIRRNGGDWSNIVSKAMDAEPVVPTTWDPLAKSVYIALSGGDLTATSQDEVDSWMPVLATKSKTSGKRYFEVLLDPEIAFPNCGIGVANTLPANFNNPGSTANGIYFSCNGVVTHNGSTVGTQPSHDTSATVVFGAALDADADKIWFSKDGVFSGDPVAGTGGYSISSIATYIPLFAGYSNDTGVLRRTASEFSYSPPTGYLGWDD